MPTYNTIGQNYAETRHPDERIVAALCQLLALPQGSLIADIGAGTGNYTNALADRGYFLRNCIETIQEAPQPPIMGEQYGAKGIWFPHYWGLGGG